MNVGYHLDEQSVLHVVDLELSEISSLLEWPKVRTDVTSFAVGAEGHAPVRHEETEGVPAEEDDTKEERPFYTSAKRVSARTSGDDEGADRLT